MPLRTAAEHAVIARLDSGRRIDAGTGQPDLEKLPHGAGARRHAVFEPEIINGGQLFRREHDLESLGAKIVHDRPHKLGKLSSLLNEPTWREFRRLRQARQLS